MKKEIKYKNLGSLGAGLEQYVIGDDMTVYSLTTRQQMTISSRNTVTLSVKGTLAKAYGIARLMRVFDDPNINFVTKPDTNADTPKATSDTRTVGTKIDNKLADKLEEIAETQDSSVSRILRIIIREFVAANSK